MTETDIIRKVQGLLAMAESSKFEPERESFYAKAQEMMVKHAIEEGMLAAAGKRVDVTPVSEMFVYSADDRNRPPKRQLFMAVAEANRCHAIFYNGSKRDQQVAIVGFKDDVDFVKLLYTSLHMQGASDASRAYRDSDRSATRIIYMTNFLLGFASTVRTRLKAQNVKVEAEVGHSMALVLVDRSKEVEDKVSELYPNLRTSRASRIGRAHGAYGKGSAAGAKADLSGGRGHVGGNGRTALGR